MLKSLWNCLAGRQSRRCEPELSAEDIDYMRAWSISAQLASLPPNYENQVPSEVAYLIQAAKSLHPQMAIGAVDRQARGEPCPELG